MYNDHEAGRLVFLREEKVPVPPATLISVYSILYNTVYSRVYSIYNGTVYSILFSSVYITVLVQCTEEYAVHCRGGRDVTEIIG